MSLTVLRRALGTAFKDDLVGDLVADLDLELEALFEATEVFFLAIPEFSHPYGHSHQLRHFRKPAEGSTACGLEKRNDLRLSLTVFEFELRD